MLWVENTFLQPLLQAKDRFRGFEPDARTSESWVLEVLMFIVPAFILILVVLILL